MSKQGDIVELKLKNGTRVVGYYQYFERKTVYISMDSGGMTSLGVAKEDIKETIEL